MFLAAARAIAELVPESELSATRIVPSAFDERVSAAVATAVEAEARRQGLARI